MRKRNFLFKAIFGYAKITIKIIVAISFRRVLYYYCFLQLLCNSQILTIYLSVSVSRIFAARKFAVGKLAARKFAVGKLAARNFRRNLEQIGRLFQYNGLYSKK